MVSVTITGLTLTVFAIPSHHKIKETRDKSVILQALELPYASFGAVVSPQALFRLFLSVLQGLCKFKTAVHTLLEERPNPLMVQIPTSMSQKREEEACQVFAFLP